MLQTDVEEHFSVNYHDVDTVYTIDTYYELCISGSFLYYKKNLQNITICIIHLALLYTYEFFTRRLLGHISGNTQISIPNDIYIYYYYLAFQIGAIRSS